MANSLTHTQSSTLMNDMVEQLTGQKVIGGVNLTNFVSVAQKALLNGYDPVLNAITQMVSRTIFSIRPYYGKLLGLEADATRWGNHIRKLSIADQKLVNDDAWTYPVLYKKEGVEDATPNRYYEGSTANPSGNKESVDMFLIRKPDVLQTNIYGRNVYSDYLTYFRNQFDVAFLNAEEYGRFISMVSINLMNRLQTAAETIGHAVLINLIGSLLDEGNNSRVIHLLSEYNTLTGQTLTATSVYAPDNFKAFIQWVFSRIEQLTSLMSERSNMFQTVVDGKPILRHTPLTEQKVYLYAPVLYQINAMVLSNTYHNDFLRLSDVEPINYWQSIEYPDSISATPVYIDTTGNLKVGAAVEQAGIFGVIFDREAAGYAITDSWSMNTPFNARAGYYTQWFHRTFNTWNDISEKALVLLLD